MPEERKLVTVLFTDVSGSTALGEGLDPEDLRALMGRYYAHARRIVDAHGGTLEKFIGDAVMAVFGLPHAHSNDAERALAAALALREAVTADAVIAGRLTLRLGVNTGSVVATTVGEDVTRGDFLVTGDAVNVAARLEQTAEPGEILVSARTAAATEASFDFGPLRAISVKGKNQPLGVYPLQAARAVHQPRRPALVGRIDDLAQLALLRDRALRERRPQLVSIVAPAGTGKTRLLDEFLARLDAGAGWRVATARCLPYGQSLTYWPLRGLLDELLDAPFSLEAVSAVFANGGYASDDARRLAGAILTALGVESEIEAEGPVDRETLFNAWRLLIEALAKQAPRIILFEDLHWASESLLDLVERIMQPNTQAALLVIATSRPELLDQRPAWGGGRRNFTALTLEPLSDEETRTLVGAVAEGIAEAMRAQIVERSGGNPFFAIELARGLAGDDAREGVVANSLPDTVQEALQEQMDALAPRERMVLQVAAVAGRAFRPATLRAALGEVEPATIEPALEGLLTRDLITPEGAGAYTFRHILIRDVAYNTLARGERIRLHLAVARWLEDFAAGRVEEFVELLAYHYAEAADLARQVAVSVAAPVDSVDMARAVGYLERAAALASRAGAFVEARAHMERALALAGEDERLRLSEAMGDYITTGEAAVAAYQEALDRWRLQHPRQDDLDPASTLTGARLLRKLAACLQISWGALAANPTLDDLQALLIEGRQLADASGDEYERWRAEINEAAFWTGRRDVYPLSEEGAERWRARMLDGAAYFEARQDWGPFVDAIECYAHASNQLAAYDDAVAAFQRALAVPALPAWNRGQALDGLANEALLKDGYDGNLAAARAALATWSPGQPILHLMGSVAALVVATLRTGEWSETRRVLPLVLAGWEQAQYSPNVINQHGGAIGIALMARGREEWDVIEAIMPALDSTLRLEWRAEDRAFVDAYLHDDPSLLDLTCYRCGRTGVIQSTIEFLSERGLIAPEELLHGARAVERRFTQARFVQARNYGWLAPPVQIAEALAAGDDTGLAAAIASAEERGLRAHAARMRIILAQRTSDRAQLERARVALERMGDRQFLRRLEVVAAELTGAPGVG